MKKNHPRQSSERDPFANSHISDSRLADRLSQTDDLIEVDFDEYNISYSGQRPAYIYESDYRYEAVRLGLGRRIFMWVAFILFALTIGILTYMTIRYNILPINTRLLMFVCVGIVFLILATMTYLGRKNSAFNKVAIVMCLIFALIFGAVDYYVVKGIATLDRFHLNAEVKIKNMSIVVLKTSSYQTLEDVKDLPIIAPLKIEQSTLDQYLADIQMRKHLDLQFEEVSSYVQAADHLYDGSAQVMVLNNSWISNIQEFHPNFLDEIRVLDQSDLKFKVETPKVESVPAGEPFSVYISGIDTYGSIESVSRSDVNIIMTINPKTHKLLLTSVPRDTRVRLAGEGHDEYDKLTHAGVLGVETSLQTLEHFLDTKINYYARVNFTTLMQLVDAVGGVDVENPNAFDTAGHHFDQGVIHLNGEEALAFSRERYNLAGGDFERGRNQQRVIIGLFRKLVSPEIIKNYNGIMDIMMKSVQTSMPPEKILSLINEMIASKNFKWDFEMTDVKGAGKSGLSSFMMPGYNLYMMEPYQDSVNEVKEKIKSYLEDTGEAESTAQSSAEGQ